MPKRLYTTAYRLPKPASAWPDTRSTRRPRSRSPSHRSNTRSHGSRSDSSRSDSGDRRDRRSRKRSRERDHDEERQRRGVLSRTERTFHETIIYNSQLRT